MNKPMSDILPRVWTDGQIELAELRARATELHKQIDNVIQSLCLIRDRLNVIMMKEQ